MNLINYIRNSKGVVFFAISYIVLIVLGINQTLAYAEKQPEAPMKEYIEEEKKHYEVTSALEAKAIKQNNQLIKLSNEISMLNQQLIKQNDEISMLKGQLQNKEQGMSFEVWSGIMLGVAALVLGAVGIGLAVFSFIGYKELINKGVEKATVVATKISKTVSENEISNLVEERVTGQINRLMDDGSFDHAVIERVENYIYRGVGSSFEDDTENT